MRISASKVLFSVAVSSMLAFFAAGVGDAWTGPPSSPPSDNVAAPINVGSILQTRSGALSISNILDVSGLTVYGDQNLYRISGSMSYINFGSPTTGGVAGCCLDTGYGFRDNAGVLQFKNYNGSWTAFSGVVQWTVSGNNIYNTNSGNVGVGLTGPLYPLDVSGTARASAFIYASDARLKSAVSALSGSLSKVLALTPVSFVWNGTSQKGKKDIGFIAQDVEKVVPEVVSTDAEGMKSVDYPKLVPVLVKAIQEQQQQIDALETEVRAMKDAR